MTRHKATKLLTKSRRKHRDGTLNEVNTGSTFARITVKRSVWFDKVRCVGNMNSNFVSPVLVQFDRQGVIKILGRNRIDTKNAGFTKILPNL